MAGTKITISILQKIDVASGMGANGIQCLNLIARAAEVNGTDRDLHEFIPGIHAIGEDWKFPRNTIVRKGVERGHADCGAGCGFAAEWIEKDLQAGDNWH